MREAWGTKQNTPTQFRRKYKSYYKTKTLWNCTFTQTYLWREGTKISLNMNALYPAGKTEAVKGASHSLYSHGIQDRPCCRTLCCILCAKTLKNIINTTISVWSLPWWLLNFFPATTVVFVRSMAWQSHYISREPTAARIVVTLLKLSTNSLPESKLQPHQIPLTLLQRLLH